MSYSIEHVEKTNNFITLPKDFQNHAATTFSVVKNTKCVRIEFKNRSFYLAWDLSINEENNNIQIPRKLAEINDIRPGTQVLAAVQEEAPALINDFTVICDNYRDYEVTLKDTKQAEVPY